MQECPHIVTAPLLARAPPAAAPELPVRTHGVAVAGDPLRQDPDPECWSEVGENPHAGSPPGW